MSPNILFEALLVALPKISHRLVVGVIVLVTRANESWTTRRPWEVDRRSTGNVARDGSAARGTIQAGWIHVAIIFARHRPQICTGP
jgi:hypothetical protein